MFICEKKVNTKKSAFFNRLVHAANVVIFSNQSNRLTSIFSEKKTNFSEYSEEHDSDPETLKISWKDKWKIVWREFVSPFHKS